MISDLPASLAWHYARKYELGLGNILCIHTREYWLFIDIHVWMLAITYQCGPSCLIVRGSLSQPSSSNNNNDDDDNDYNNNSNLNSNGGNSSGSNSNTEVVLQIQQVVMEGI